MQNKGWLRYSLASLTLVGAGLGAFLVACGDDDDSVTPGPKDSGLDTSMADTGAPDAPVDAPAPVDAGTNAKLQLVNAATDLGANNPVGAVRICYGLGEAGTIAPLPPLPDRKASDAQPYPGVFIGTGGTVQGTGADLTNVAITPYVMNAQALAQRGLVKPDAGGTGKTCIDILEADAGGALVEGVDYWKLQPIPAGTFTKEKSFILVLSGCTADSQTAAAKCGADATDAGVNGNLKVVVYEVDRATAIAADKIGTQFIHASPAGDAVITQGAGIAFQPAYMTDAQDAGSAKPVSTGNVAVGAKTDLVQVEGVKFDAPSDYFTANPNANPAVLPIAIPLTSIQLLSYGANVPAGGNYRNGAAFTFIAVGDPQEDADAGGSFNTKKFHYIALPNDPVTEVYKP